MSNLLTALFVKKTLLLLLFGQVVFFRELIYIQIHTTYPVHQVCYFS